MDCDDRCCALKFCNRYYCHLILLYLCADGWPLWAIKALFQNDHSDPNWYSFFCKGTIWLAGSPSITGAVIRKHWLQFYTQFISLLVAYRSQLAAAVICFMPYSLPSFLKCCSAGSADLLYWVLLIPIACQLFLLFPLVHCTGVWQPLIYSVFCCACWDSLSALCMLG